MKYHLIGVGGIGMSALARILLQRGVQVQGSDQKASQLLDQLEAEGAQIFRHHDPASLEEGMAVVYSSDIKEENVELQRAKEMKLPLLHRRELLAELMQGQRPLLVTGTHGKTTTSSLLASVLHEAELDPSFALGGILRSFQSNGRSGSGPFFVAEADESDGSFLKPFAFGAIVTNCNLDHLDFWKNEENLQRGFSQFFSQVLEKKHLFWCKDDRRLSEMAPEGFSYGFSCDADLCITHFEEREGGILFDLSFAGKEYRKISLSLLGRHNALNGAAVFGLGLTLQIPEEAMRRAFLQFSGAKRRLEWKGEVNKVDFFDDYGHHPVEIQATLAALRGEIKERRLLVIFQPHRYTRVRDLFEEFLHAFSEADELILTDIFSAGEAPIPEVTTALLYTKMRELCKERLHFFPRAHLENGVVGLLQPLDVVLTIGAGDVTLCADLLLEKWREKQKTLKVAILCGGESAEHAVSLASAKNVASWADSTSYDLTLLQLAKDGKNFPIDALQACDVVIPVLHGPRGEDGMVQGFLETLKIPYAGCDYLSGPLCMNKRFTKELALMQGIPTAPYFCMKKGDAVTQRALSFPLWVKPLHLGSSIGVGKAHSLLELQEKVETALLFDDELIVEKHIEGRQIEFGILGNRSLWVGPPCEIINGGAFVDYEGKYGQGAFPYRIPAALSEVETALGIELAQKTYRALGCAGIARVDFFIDEKGSFWLNEVNPFPGCTDSSAFPKICEAAKMPMQKVFDRLVACALHRSRGR